MAKPKKFNIGAWKEAEAGIESGLLTQKEALEKLPPLYQPLLSKQQELNKLISEQTENHKGYLGQFRKGLGLSIDQGKVDEARAAVINAQHFGTEKNIKDATEGISSLNRLNKAQEEIFNDMKTFFPGIFSAIEMATRLQTLWNSETLKNPYTAIAAILLAIGSIALMIIKRVNSIKEKFGLTNQEARALNRQMIKTNLLMKKNGISATQISQAFESLTSTFGEVGPAAYRFAGQMSLVARNSGITAENATEMVSLFQAIHGVTKEVALDMITSTTEMARLTGLSPGVIIREMAENADSFASHLGKSEQNLMAAVAQAKKLGMEFNSLESFGDGLLDITERINKEQMLSAMLGKQVSFEQAAMLNAQGRSAEYMIEMSKQLQGVEDLSAVERRLFAGQMDMAVADVMKLRGLQSGMATKTATIPGQNPYEQASFKQRAQMLKKIDYPAHTQ